MKPRKATFLLHRWIGLMVCLQLLAWSLGGLIFSVFEIANVRGETESDASLFDPLASTGESALPSSVLELLHAQRDAGQAVGSVALVNRGAGPQWEVRDLDGELLSWVATARAATGGILTPEEAQRLALRDFAPEITGVSIELIEADPPSEYRSGPLPAYQVVLDSPTRAHLYVDARSGRITARRNRQWRIFDFFWMLHTMDYAGRDDFNHPLLTGFSILAVTTSLTGMALWGWRLRSRWWRKPNARRADGLT